MKFQKKKTVQGKHQVTAIFLYLKLRISRETLIAFFYILMYWTHLGYGDDRLTILGLELCLTRCGRAVIALFSSKWLQHIRIVRRSWRLQNSDDEPNCDHWNLQGPWRSFTFGLAVRQNWKKKKWQTVKTLWANETVEMYRTSQNKIMLTFLHRGLVALLSPILQGSWWRREPNGEGRSRPDLGFFQSYSDLFLKLFFDDVRPKFYKRPWCKDRCKFE